MAEFEDEIRNATQRLRELALETDRAARGSRRREEEEEQRSVISRLSATLGGLTPAANAFGQTGSFEDAADVASGSIVDAVAKSFPFLSAALGVEKERRAREGARDETVGLLDDLARHNVPVSDEFLQKVIDVKVAQHERIEELRGRVTARTSLGVTEAAGLAGDRTVDLLTRIADSLDALRNIMPGAQ